MGAPERIAPPIILTTIIPKQKERAASRRTFDGVSDENLRNLLETFEASEISGSDSLRFYTAPLWIQHQNVANFLGMHLRDSATVAEAVVRESLIGVKGGSKGWHDRSFQNREGVRALMVLSAEFQSGSYSGKDAWQQMVDSIIKKLGADNLATVFRPKAKSAEKDLECKALLAANIKNLSVILSPDAPNTQTAASIVGEIGRKLYDFSSSERANLFFDRLKAFNVVNIEMSMVSGQPDEVFREAQDVVLFTAILDTAVLIMPTLRKENKALQIRWERVIDQTIERLGDNPLGPVLKERFAAYTLMREQAEKEDNVKTAEKARKMPILEEQLLEAARWNIRNLDGAYAIAKANLGIDMVNSDRLPNGVGLAEVTRYVKNKLNGKVGTMSPHGDPNWIDLQIGLPPLRQLLLLFPEYKTARDIAEKIDDILPQISRRIEKAREEQKQQVMRKREGEKLSA